MITTFSTCQCFAYTKQSVGSLLSICHPSGVHWCHLLLYNVRKVKWEETNGETERERWRRTELVVVVVDVVVISLRKRENKNRKIEKKSGGKQDKNERKEKEKGKRGIFCGNLARLPLNGHTRFLINILISESMNSMAYFCINDPRNKGATLLSRILRHFAPSQFSVAMAKPGNMSVTRLELANLRKRLCNCKIIL